MASMDCALLFIASPSCNLPARISPRNQEGRFTCKRVACWALSFVAAFALIGIGFASMSSEPDERRYGAGAGIGAGVGALAAGLFFLSVPDGRPAGAAVAPAPEVSLSSRDSIGPMAVAVVPSAESLSRREDVHDRVSLSSISSNGGPVDIFGDKLRVNSVSLSHG